MLRFIKLLRYVDYTLLGSILAILIFSLIVLSSASLNLTADPMYFVRRQLGWILLGIAALTLLLLMDYSRLGRFARVLYVVNILLLLAVLFLGTQVKGSTRWFSLGPFIFQPSEFAKLLMIIAFADFLVRRQGKLNRLRDLMLCFAFMLPPILLVALQPDLGTSLVFLGIMLGMMLVAGVRPLLLGGAVLCGFLLLMFIAVLFFQGGLPEWFPLEDYQVMRLVVFLDPYSDGMGGRGAGYHLIQSQVAIGSGGFWGKGLYQGTQVQLQFLPEHHTDFIFSVVGEELGFAGAFLLICLYFLLIYRMLKIASEARDLFGSLVVVGIASMFSFHVLVNMGMTVGMMPVTGLPLPLFSYGGSSMLMNIIALGLVLNVYARRQKILF